MRSLLKRSWGLIQIDWLPGFLDFHNQSRELPEPSRFCRFDIKGAFSFRPADWDRKASHHRSDLPHGWPGRAHFQLRENQFGRWMGEIGGGFWSVNYAPLGRGRYTSAATIVTKITCKTPLIIHLTAIDPGNGITT